MYKVSTQLNSSYGVPEPKSGPDMPHVTVGDKRMTNVHLGNGEIVHGIRRNKDIDNIMHEEVMSCEVPGLRPLRYTPGLNCDPHLESLRPERHSNHQALQGGDQWKKKLIQHPKTYEGSFVDANMQDFRPCPNVEDKWMTSRLPNGSSEGLERLAAPSSSYYGPSTSPYDQMYPQDELSQIKMRNRRFQNSIVSSPQGEPMMRGSPMYGPLGPAAAYPPYVHPMMMMMPPPMMSPYQSYPAPPGTCPLPPSYSSEQPLDDLSIIDQELNMTRRATRPYVPSESPDYNKLQKHLDDLEQEQMKIVKKPIEPIVSTDQLPPPKKVPKAPLTEATAPKTRPEVRIADQIAIRSYVLGQNMGKIGGSKDKSEE